MTDSKTDPETALSAADGAEAAADAPADPAGDAPADAPGDAAAGDEAAATSVTFADCGLDDSILKALAESGYTTPTPIQAAAIPEALKGRDVLGIAQTGTGKTASFTLPMIQRLAKGRARARMPRSLVLAPTRELAAQVAENFEKYGKHYKLSMALLIGGVSFGDQDAKLTRGVDVLIATPGRLLDHFERGRLLLTGIEVMVVDEADRMLDMGFIPDIERIFNLTQSLTRQTLFFSATMPPEIQRLTDRFLSAPVRIEAARPATAAETIEQRVVMTPSGDDAAKRTILRALLNRDDVRNGIVFCNRKSTVDVVAKSLQKHGFNARPIHGDLPQAFRTETLDGFRSGAAQFLIASDVAARGLDIPQVSHVFNYDVPVHAEDYVHRIGRTGRAGARGATYMMVAPKDEKAYAAILSTIGREAIDVLELDPAVLAEAETRAAGARERRPRSDARRSGPERRERGGRRRRAEPAAKSGEGSSRSDAADGAPAPVEAATPTQAEPVNDASAAPDRTGSDRSAPDRPAKEAARRRDPDERPRRRREAADAPPPVLGFGDNAPAFMLR